MFDYRERRHSSHRSYSHSRRRHSLLEVDASPTMVKTNVCVEYDIHKACARDCNSLECQKIPVHRREVGLAFWRGRCDPIKNARRAEILAHALGINHAATTHSLARSPSQTTCLVGDSESMCYPEPSTGGMYCSRSWAGVCQPCYIPGTAEQYPEAHNTPVCPWDILRVGSDYSNPALHPKCASDLPREYCCLYTKTCDPDLVQDIMNISIPATEDGFAYVSSMQNTDLMKA